MPLSSLCCSFLVTFKPTFMLFVCLLELSLLALLTFPTFWLQVPATVFPVLLTLCYVQADVHTLFTSFPSYFPSSIHICRSSGIMLSMRTIQLNHLFPLPCMCIMFHPVRWTHRQMVRQTSTERTNVGLAHTHPK